MIVAGGSTPTLPIESSVARQIVWRGVVAHRIAVTGVVGGRPAARKSWAISPMRAAAIMMTMVPRVEAIALHGTCSEVARES